MDVSVDIGKNLTSLLERLAQQIGTTVDKIYPWYVQQAYNEGVTALFGITVVFLLSVTILAVGLFLTYTSANRDTREVGGGVCFASGCVLILTVIIGSFE